MKPKSSQPSSKSKTKRRDFQGNYVDIFVKRMFSRIFLFVDFLMFYADQRFVTEIDLTKIVPAPTHYIGKAGDERIADLVFQCPLKNGTGTVMAVIVFEHQSGSLKKIPRKLLRYISAIWDAETKEGKKILSAPYFIVLRTAKKPHRGKYPRMADSLPKGRDGKPLGKVVEIEYDVVDLPARDFDNLVGGAVLRVVLGIMKKMLEDQLDEYDEVLKLIEEITDDEEQFELTKEILQFMDKAYAAHNRRIDEAKLQKTLDPYLRKRGKTMIRSIFEEKFDEGYAEGEARGKVESLLNVLHARFHRVSKKTEKVVRSMTDSVALDSWIELAATCQSLTEFEKAIKS
jgi:hypothetical protein